MAGTGREPAGGPPSVSLQARGGLGVLKSGGPGLAGSRSLTLSPTRSAQQGASGSRLRSAWRQVGGRDGTGVTQSVGYGGGSWAGRLHKVPEGHGLGWRQVSMWSHVVAGQSRRVERGGSRYHMVFTELMRGWS